MKKWFPWIILLLFLLLAILILTGIYQLQLTIIHQRDQISQLQRERQHAHELMFQMGCDENKQDPNLFLEIRFGIEPHEGTCSLISEVSSYTEAIGVIEPLSQQPEYWINIYCFDNGESIEIPLSDYKKSECQSGVILINRNP